MSRPFQLSTSIGAVVLGILTLVVLWGFPSPTQGQDSDSFPCLSRQECHALKQQLREYRQELGPLRRELRRLRQQIRELPDGEERDALIEQARQRHREVRQLRRERRPISQRFRHGCRPECWRA